MFPRPKLCIIAALLACMLHLTAESTEVTTSDNWLVRTWQTDRGLPDNNITGIAQTADGYLWVATLGGLIRFDGARFEEFSTTHFPKVPNRNVRKMHLDRHGRLWLSLDRGALIRVGENTARVFDAEDGFSSSRVAVIAEDNEDGVWFVAGNEILGIRGEKVEQFGSDEGLPSGGGSWLVADESGQLWFARGAQVGVFRNSRWQVLLTLDSGPVRLAAARGGGLWICTPTRLLKFVEGSEPREVARLPERVGVKVILEDHAGALWIGTGSDGLLCWRNSSLEHVAVSHPEISALMEDREGNLWVGTTGGGLNLLRPRAVDVITTKSGLPYDSARSVCQDADGWIWAALQNGSLARGRSNMWSQVSSVKGWEGCDATCVAPARGGGVWVGTHGQGLRRIRGDKMLAWSPSDGLGSQNVRSLLQAANGDLWIGTEGPSRLQLFKAGKFHDLKIPADVRSVRALVQGVGGIIWAGTSDGYVLRVDGTNVVNEIGVQENAEGRAYSVRCLHASQDGSLWIGYAGWGVGRLFKGQYSRVTTAQGLYDDYISQILSDGHDGIWMTGNRGLFQVRLDELVSVAEGLSNHVRSIAYGTGEGLPSVQTVFENSPTAWRAVSGQLWFATRNGLLTVQPEKISGNPLSPHVLLTEVKVDDQLVALHDSRSALRSPSSLSLVNLKSPGVSVELPPRHGKIEFEFTALSFNSPENVHFRHRLKNFDTDWVEAGTQRIAKYPRLNPGAYEFEVTACNEAGVWSEDGFHLPFVVQPIFWQTWWFRVGVVLVFTASVIGVVRYFSFRRLRAELDHLARQAELQKERTRIARDMHDEVGSKLSRLSLLSEMAIHKTELSREACEDVSEISETARDTIRSFEEIVWAVNPKNDSLANLVHYLCRFAEEFFEGSGVPCAFELPDNIPDLELPTEVRHHVFLAAKEALNNAFKHAHANQVVVRLKLEVGSFNIEIDDDGGGCSTAAVARRAGVGNGLENIRERLQSVGGRFDMQSNPGKGTRVTLSVPCPQLKHI